MEHYFPENRNPSHYRADHPLGRAALDHLDNLPRDFPEQAAAKAMLFLLMPAALAGGLYASFNWGYGEGASALVALAIFAIPIIAVGQLWHARENRKSLPYRHRLVKAVIKYERDKPLEQRAEVVYGHQSPKLVKDGIVIAGTAVGPSLTTNDALDYCRAACRIATDAEAS